MSRSHGVRVLLASLPPSLPPGRILSSFGTAGLHQYSFSPLKFSFPNCMAVSDGNRIMSPRSGVTPGLVIYPDLKLIHQLIQGDVPLQQSQLRLPWTPAEDGIVVG